MITEDPPLYVTRILRKPPRPGQATRHQGKHRQRRSNNPQENTKNSRTSRVTKIPFRW